MIKKIVITLLIDTETGKVDKTFEMTDTESATTPQLYLYKNKCTLNEPAMKLLNVKRGDEVIIVYDNVNNNHVPVIGKTKAFGIEKGAKITGTNSFSLRGIKNEMLLDYGDKFDITPHETKEGVFVLTAIKSQVIEHNCSEGSCNFKSDKTLNSTVNMDDVDYLINSVADDTKEETDINSDYFKL